MRKDDRLRVRGVIYDRTAGRDRSCSSGKWRFLFCNEGDRGLQPVQIMRTTYNSWMTFEGEFDTRVIDATFEPGIERSPSTSRGGIRESDYEENAASRSSLDATLSRRVFVALSARPDERNGGTILTRSALADADEQLLEARWKRVQRLDAPVDGGARRSYGQDSVGRCKMRSKANFELQ